MCKAIDGMLKDSEKAGRLQIIRNLVKSGMEEAQIIKLTECTKAEYAKAAKTAKG